MMTKNERRVDTTNAEQEQSPSEKLETEKPISPPTPGIEDPDSEELKDETSPNTE
ncbi:MAG: hypothetical protein JWM21_3610 [Acidobacteria bacterium]|nr:hypothetical protein [Acidobacteriota bacterium]